MYVFGALRVSVATKNREISAKNDDISTMNASQQRATVLPNSRAGTALLPL
jgi:hypothetical protein